jgi:hypothetical protein
LKNQCWVPLIVLVASLTTPSLAQAETSPSYDWWIPVAAHLPGVNNSFWQTDVGVLNPGTGHATVQVIWYSSSAHVLNLTVGPGAQLSLEDVVMTLYGMSGSGALEIKSDQPLVLTSRTFNKVPGDSTCFPNGTLGQSYPAVQSGDGLGAGQTGILANLREDAAYRTNIGLINAGSAPASVTVNLLDGATQSIIGAYSLTLSPGESKQTNRPFLSVAGQTNLRSGYARVSVGLGGGIYAYASLIDNITNNPTTIGMVKQ